MSEMERPTNGRRPSDSPKPNRSTRSREPKPDASHPSAGPDKPDTTGDVKSKLANGVGNQNPGKGYASPAPNESNASRRADRQGASASRPEASGGQSDKRPGGVGRNHAPSMQGNPSRETSETPDPKRRDLDAPMKPNAGQPAGDGAGHADTPNSGADNDSGAAGAKRTGGALGAAKGLGANATGVDYSDKGLKDRLEHQAADVAMDATPVLGQANSARKALKEFNKAKKEAGGPEGITDKAEEVVDDGIDKGIKGVKIAAGAKVTGDVGMGAMALAMTMKMLMMMKGMALAALSKIGGFFAGVFSAISSAVSGFLGTTAAIGNAIAAGIMSIVLAGTSVLGVGIVQEVTKNDDSALLACVPSRTSVPESSQDYIQGEGELAAMKEDYAVKLWSVYSELGGSKEQAAAVLGNFDAESGIDPTSVETIYDEKYHIGPKSQAAWDADFLIDVYNPSYGARFPAIEYAGIGLGQWTNGRNRLLINFAEEKGLNWYDFDTQIAFMLSADDPGRVKMLMNFISKEPGNVDAEVLAFMTGWEGLPAGEGSLSHRQQSARGFMFILERASVDTDYADSILSGLNVNRGDGNAAAGAYHQDDGCGNPIKSHYGNQAVDGTGEVPADLVLVPWTRETLPESLREFAKNPEDAGLAWGSASGWTNGIIPDQCAALAHSYFIQLYPDWNKKGRPTTRPFGDGREVAAKWAAHYGEQASKSPAAGAVFSDATTSVYGHTGIVQHVFANGDILINEQNIRGASGAGAGLNYSWSWRVIRKDTYIQKNWVFFKPSDAEPQWVKPK